MWDATWEFPKARGPTIDPEVVGLLIQRHIRNGSPNLWKLPSIQARVRRDHFG